MPPREPQRWRLRSAAQALRRASVLLSFGLASNWSFERDALALNPGLAIHAYDHTVGPKHFAKAAVLSVFSAPLLLIRLSPRKSMRSLRKLRNSLDYFRFFKRPLAALRTARLVQR